MFDYGINKNIDLKGTIKKEQLISKLEKIERLKYNIKENAITGYLMPEFSFFTPPYSNFLKITFPLNENEAKNFEITPNFLGKLGLTIYLLAAIFTLFLTFFSTKTSNLVGSSITVAGFVFIFWIVRNKIKAHSAILANILITAIE